MRQNSNKVHYTKMISKIVVFMIFPHIFHDLGLFPTFSHGFPRVFPTFPPRPGGHHLHRRVPRQAVALQRQRVAEFHGAREELQAEVRDAHLEQMDGKN